MERGNSTAIRVTLAVRGLLEFVTLIAIVFAVASIVGGVVGVVIGLLASVATAAIWGVFAVPDDPSRGGSSPVPVPGAVRLAIEFVVFAAGVWAIGVWLGAAVAVVMGFLTVAHYASWPARLRWLLSR